MLDSTNVVYFGMGGRDQEDVCKDGISVEAIGFLLPFAFGTLGAPLITLGSFMSVGSSFAGMRLMTCR